MVLSIDDEVKRIAMETATLEDAIRKLSVKAEESKQGLATQRAVIILCILIAYQYVERRSIEIKTQQSTTRHCSFRKRFPTIETTSRNQIRKCSNQSGFVKIASDSKVGKSV